MKSYIELGLFLQDKFAFKSFEIDNWLYSKIIFRYKLKEHAEEFNTELGFKYLETDKIDSWVIVGLKEVDFIFDEFFWYMTYSKRVKTGIKSKESKLKKHILDVVKSQAELVQCDKRIKPFFDKQRVKVSGVNPLPESLRKPVDGLKIGDSCYIFRNNEGVKFVDPCIVYDIDLEANTKYSIMYFSNYGINKNKTEIDGYNFANVLPTEIGLTPEQAVKNRY